ncbi:MAG TPA: pyridoxamine 5'-phosphate oxidase family protein [Jiangellales bacterium]|nr:pyridoxamine 5'-phosphate oxidase family protein [Jiangellales bacterium]
MARVDPRTGMTILDETTCWGLLSAAEVHRLAVVVGDDLEIFPVNAAVDGRTLIFSTGEGTKLAAVTIARNVVVEADGYDAATQEAWSVVLKGEAERLDHFDDIERAESLALRSWSDHPKQWFVRVTPRSISGRQFAVSPR